MTAATSTARSIPLAPIAIGGALLLAVSVAPSLPAPQPAAIPSGQVVALSVPELGEVRVGTHADEKHGAEAERVRRFYAETVDIPAEFFGQPPCSDGRHRLVVMNGEEEWMVWVIERVAPGLFIERTAFVLHDRAYVNAVRDKCGNGSWFGHLYAQVGEGRHESRGALDTAGTG